MSIITIRAQLATILDAIPGINSASGYPPDAVGALPAAWCGLNDRAIDYTAGMEVNEHTLSVIVLIDRISGRLKSNLASVETIAEAFMTVMRANISLNNTVNIALVSRIQEDTIDIGRVPYIGFVATLNVTEKFGVSLSG